MSTTPWVEITFPVTVGHVPDGLGQVLYDRDIGFTAAARWTAADAIMSVTVADENRFEGTVEGTIDVAGTPAEILDLNEHLAIVHELGDDGIAVSGTGTLADAAQLEWVAESVRPEEQEIDLNLTMAPQEWQPAKFKDGVIVTYTADGTAETASTTRASPSSWMPPLEVSPTSRTSPSTVEQHTWVGAWRTHTSLKARPHKAGILDPSPLLASFTREQVLELASGVRD